ncbi:MAG: hypothetical protein KKG01_07490, partial [Candidatus Omnitrophica bacterium]|nr:hypothetical protein [Candidatus Omnitrophota bacterium]
MNEYIQKEDLDTAQAMFDRSSSFIFIVGTDTQLRVLKLEADFIFKEHGSMTLIHALKLFDRKGLTQAQKRVLAGHILEHARNARDVSEDDVSKFEVQVATKLVTMSELLERYTDPAETGPIKIALDDTGTRSFNIDRDLFGAELLLKDTGEWVLLLDSFDREGITRDEQKFLAERIVESAKKVIGASAMDMEELKMRIALKLFSVEDLLLEYKASGDSDTVSIQDARGPPLTIDKKVFRSELLSKKAQQEKLLTLTKTLDDAAFLALPLEERIDAQTLHDLAKLILDIEDEEFQNLFKDRNFQNILNKLIVHPALAPNTRNEVSKKIFTELLGDKAGRVKFIQFIKDTPQVRQDAVKLLTEMRRTVSSGDFWFNEIKVLLYEIACVQIGKDKVDAQLAAANSDAIYVDIPGIGGSRGIGIMLRVPGKPGQKLSSLEDILTTSTMSIRTKRKLRNQANAVEKGIQEGIEEYAEKIASMERDENLTPEYRKSLDEYKSRLREELMWLFANSGMRKAWEVLGSGGSLTDKDVMAALAHLLGRDIYANCAARGLVDIVNTTREIEAKEKGKSSYERLTIEEAAGLASRIILSALADKNGLSVSGQQVRFEASDILHTYYKQGEIEMVSEVITPLPVVMAMGEQLGVGLEASKVDSIDDVYLMAVNGMPLMMHLKPEHNKSLRVGHFVSVLGVASHKEQDEMHLLISEIGAESASSESPEDVVKINGKPTYAISLRDEKLKERFSGYVLAPKSLLSKRMEKLRRSGLDSTPRKPKDVWSKDNMVGGSSIYTPVFHAADAVARDNVSAYSVVDLYFSKEKLSIVRRAVNAVQPRNIVDWFRQHLYRTIDGLNELSYRNYLAEISSKWTMRFSWPL